MKRPSIRLTPVDQTKISLPKPCLILCHRLERDAKLGALEERADALQDGAAQFEKQAGSLKNKFWMENLKSMIAMGVVGLLLLGMLYWKFSDDATAPAYPYPMPPMPYPPPQAAPVPPGGGGSGGAAAAQGGP